jgi:hypothetical protein
MGMANGSCFQNLSGSTNNCIKTSLTANGKIETTLIIKPYFPAGYIPSTSLFLNPTQTPSSLIIDALRTDTTASADRNVLLCHKLGVNVTTGTTKTLLLYRSFDTNELVGDVRIAPAPVPSNPCDPIQPNLNALHKTADGLEVLAQGLPSYITAAQVANSLTTVTYVDCATNELRAHVIVAPEITGDNCSPLVDLTTGKAIKKNALYESPAGLAVLTGKETTSPIETYQDCTTHELHAKLWLVSNPGCDGLVNARGTNAATIIEGKLAVLTGKNAAGGITTFLDCASNELRAELVVSPDPSASNCSTNPKTNAFRLFSDGWGVKVGATNCIETFVDCNDNDEIKSKLIFPLVDRSLFGPAVLAPQNAAHCTDKGLVVEVGPNVDGGIHLYVDQATQVVEGRIVVKPNPAGAACDPATATNAFKLTPEGAAVEVGDSCSIDMFVDCPSQSIRAKAILTEAGGLECNGGLKVKLAPGCNGLVSTSAGLSGFPGAPKGTASFVNAGLGTIQGGTASFTRPKIDVTWTNPADSCMNAMVELIFKAPTFYFDYTASNVSGLTAEVSYGGTISGGTTIGEIYGRFLTGDKTTRWGAGGPTEHYFINLLPGQTVSASMTPSANIIANNANTLQVTLGSYALSGVVHWGSKV